MVLSFDKGVDCTWKYKGVLGLHYEQCLHLMEMVADYISDFDETLMVECDGEYV